MKRIWKTLFALAMAAAIAGCANKEAPSPEPVRAVRTITLAPERAPVSVFAGEMKPRHETRLAFRVGGQLLERRVELGTAVRAGQVIAVLDGRDLKLAASAARAQLAQAQTQARLAEADFKRFSELRARNFISQAEYDRREAQWQQARESAEAAGAEAARLANQAGYAVLEAPHAGIITAIEAEAGQVLAAGQTVVRLARPEEKEVAFSIPENQLETLRRARGIEVRFWYKPEAVFAARLREIAPVADPVSRTYAARLSLPNPDAGLALGMSAEVTVIAPADPQLRVPATAIFHDGARAAVWLVDGEPAVVRLTPVELGTASGDSIAVRSGVAPGQVVVTAGVHALQPGQKVRPMSDALLAGGRT